MKRKTIITTAIATVLVLITGIPTSCAKTEFRLDSLEITPSKVAAGDTVTVTVDLSNVGASEGTHTVIIEVNRIVVDSKDVTIPGGATRKVTFSVVKETTGVYNVDIEGLVGTFHVVPPVQTALPFQTPVLPDQAGYQFARQYTIEQLLSDEDVINEFIDRVLVAEARFHQPGVGYNPVTGVTYDGHAINQETGELAGVPREWSAVSKESLHVTILTLAVAGNKRACLYVSPDNPEVASNIAIDILTKKMTSYERFNQDSPGFGGFIPWFLNLDNGLRPANDWQNRVPGLDSGQWAWSLFLAADVLEQQGYTELAARYRDYWQMLARNSVMVFFDPPTGKIRVEAKIHDTKAHPHESNYSNNTQNYFLEDPFEGELMVLFMSIFGQWGEPGQVEAIWQNKTIEVVDYHTLDGRTITVRKGHWFSSHEQWNKLVLPYLDIDLIWRVFVNGEKARTWYSAEYGIPGLFASVNSPDAPYIADDYLSDLGVPGLGEQQVMYKNIVAPYAAFPVIIARKDVGVAWLQTMITGPRMQGPYGVTESTTVDGQYIAPLLTWDGKATTVLALIGESTDFMREALIRKGVYDKFLQLVQNEYEEAFRERVLEGEDLPFRTPTTGIPLCMPDFRKATSIKVTDVHAE